MLGSFFVKTINGGDQDNNETKANQHKLSEDAFLSSGEVVGLLFIVCLPLQEIFLVHFFPISQNIKYEF